MLSHLSNLVCRSAQSILMLLCLGLTGCASWDARPQSEATPPDTGIGAGFRKPGPPGQLLGIDERAREIERDLGVR